MIDVYFVTEEYFSKYGTNEMNSQSETIVDIFLIGNTLRQQLDNI